MDEILRHPASQPCANGFYNRKGRFYAGADYYGNRPTSEGERRNQISGTAYYSNARTSNDQQLFNISRCDGRTCNRYTQSPVNDLDLGDATTYPWFCGTKEADTSSHYWDHTGSSHKALFGVTNINSHNNEWYTRPTSAHADDKNKYVNETLVNITKHHDVAAVWRDNDRHQRSGEAEQQYFYKRELPNGSNVCIDRKPLQKQESLSLGRRIACVPFQGAADRQHGGQAQLDKHRPYDLCYQQQSSHQQKDDIELQPQRIGDGASRKRKLSGENEATTNNNGITKVTKIDKRALYSKFRVVKKTDRSPKCTESSKSKPVSWRVNLDDKTIVDVNDVDGLSDYTKRSNIVPTLTPTKQNEADAAIGNIKFITLENMKVVRRKLELVLVLQQEQERQERLKLEAEVGAKVKVNAKEKARKDKKRKDRSRHVKNGL